MSDRLTLRQIADITGESYMTVYRRIVEEKLCRFSRVGKKGARVWVYLDDLRRSEMLQGWYRPIAIHFGVYEELPPY